jgi:hypothetical protein
MQRSGNERVENGWPTPRPLIASVPRQKCVGLAIRMDYYFYNTDADSLREAPLPRFPVLIERGFAAVGGDRQKFGEQLRQLRPDDILLMYENGVHGAGGEPKPLIRKVHAMRHTYHLVLTPNGFLGNWCSLCR